ncbi:MBL fold metallo-hydrolase [Candidatus Micrarchaeota archaeon]|nr:MBL fold metallo-hydrolase [Candidatus Micrarchaeota archaeon]
MVDLRYFGHSCFEISVGGRMILTDPWFGSEGRLIQPAVQLSSIKKADLILISHEHHDHCDPKAVEDLVERTLAQVVGPEDALGLLNINPRNKVSVLEGDSFSLMGIDLIVTKANHPQSSYPVGYIIQCEGKSVYFAGDTYDFYDMVNINVDLAIIPIGGTYTMDTFSAIKALKTMKTRFVIPMHYGTFERIHADVEDFVRRVKKDTKVQPIQLALGEFVSV